MFLERTKTYQKQSLLFAVVVIFLMLTALFGRVIYLMVFQSGHYGEMARDIQERERSIKAERGKIYDRNGIEIAGNKPVSTISVIHSQITEPERVISILSKELGLSEETVRKRVEKVSSIERIKSNVEKEISDRIRGYELDGVMIDEDYKRFYPFGTLASKVIGFTGSDNQGIIGLEVAYDEILQGKDGTILTLTTAKGIEIEDAAENRIEPIAGNDLFLSLDVNIQKYAEQAARKVMEAKAAKSVKLIVMNPQNGEIYAMVNAPEFDLNHPYTLNKETEEELSGAALNEALNAMWRNECLSDTYEPGSTFKIFTATACLDAGLLHTNDTFYCPGYRVVEDRKIRCHKVGGHGSETFVEGIQNSCNPVFMEIGAKLGTEKFYSYFEKYGLDRKTNIDLPGEANTIIHKKENVGPVELATMSFGQSFQITPIQLATTVSTIVNGGVRITPHLGVQVLNDDGEIIQKFHYDREQVLSEKTSKQMRELLESVVSQGTGKNAYIEGYEIGGKTATSQTLPRSANKYISSFVGFAPAENPQVLALVVIYNPQGVYYGGTVAAPVIRSVFENILPYLGIEKTGE